MPIGIMIVFFLIFIGAFIDRKINNKTKIAEIILLSDKLEVLADGVDEVVLDAKLYDKDKNLMDSSDIVYYQDMTRLKGDSFSSEVEGLYGFTAVADGKISNEISVEFIISKDSFSIELSKIEDKIVFGIELSEYTVDIEVGDEDIRYAYIFLVENKQKYIYKTLEFKERKANCDSVEFFRDTESAYIEFKDENGDIIGNIREFKLVN